MILELQFFFALIITIVIELTLLLVISKVFFKKKMIEKWRIYFVGVIASALTLPYFWYFFPAFQGEYLMVVGELVVVAVETFIIYRIIGLNLEKAFFISLFINIISFAVGIAIF